MDKLVAYLNTIKDQEMTIKEGQRLLHMLNSELSEVFTLFTKKTGLKLSGMVTSDNITVLEEEHLYNVRIQGVF